MVATATLFDTGKDVHHEWLGTDKIALAGYKNRERVFLTVNITDLSRPISSIKFGSGSGVPHLKYDHDTRMIFLYVKVSRLLVLTSDTNVLLEMDVIMVTKVVIMVTKVVVMVTKVVVMVTKILFSG